MNERNTSILNSVILIFNLLVCLMIIIAGTVLISQQDTNGYFVICIGLQFFIMKSRNVSKREKE